MNYLHACAIELAFAHLAVPDPDFLTGGAGQCFGVAVLCADLVFLTVFGGYFGPHGAFALARLDFLDDKNAGLQVVFLAFFLFVFLALLVLSVIFSGWFALVLVLFLLLLFQRIKD